MAAPASGRPVASPTAVPKAPPTRPPPTAPAVVLLAPWQPHMAASKLPRIHFFFRPRIRSLLHPNISGAAYARLGHNGQGQAAFWVVHFARSDRIHAVVAATR